jgi:hypothetical protein
MSSHDVGAAGTKLWIVPETRNSVLPFHDPVDPIGDFFYRKLAVDDMQFAFAPVIIDQRLRLLVIHNEACADRFGIIIRAALKRGASAPLADAFGFRKPEIIVVAFSTVRASEATCDALDKLIVVHINDDNRINCFIVALQEVIQFGCLLNRARKSVQNEAR